MKSLNFVEESKDAVICALHVLATKVKMLMESVHLYPSKASELNVAEGELPWTRVHLSTVLEGKSAIHQALLVLLLRCFFATATRLFHGSTHS